MVKCKSCSDGRCEGKYENRGRCDDRENCTCTCQETPGATFWKATGSIGLGVAAFAGGVALTISTGGLGLVGVTAGALAGGALTGVGATAAIHPVAKQMSGERMTGGDYAKDLLIGGTVGAVTGPIGAGGASATTSIASKVGTEGVKQGVTKLACRSAVGAVSGAAGSAIGEGINAASDDKASFSVSNVLKGAALGAVTGGASHATANVAKFVSPGVANSAVKVVGDTLSTVAIDGTTQLIVDGEIDPKRLALNASARAATSAGFEAVSSATYRAHGGRDALRDKLGDEEILKANPKDSEEILKIQKQLPEVLGFDELEKQTRIATRTEKAIAQHQANQEAVRVKEQRLADINKRIESAASDLKQNPASIDHKNVVRDLQIDKKAALKEINVAKRSVNTFKNEHLSGKNDHLPDYKMKPDLIGDNNIHVLHSDRIGQVAADLPDPATPDGRGVRRVLFDVKLDNDLNVKFKLAGVSNEHYKDAPLRGQVTNPPLHVAEPFILPKDFDDEDSE